ncbi:MAG: formylglycine-generating enzyme family protein [Leptospiraceae bacterium]|nr:formylglycine-generating enzyme family protein [Leptospiraceae bacterium]MDW7975609.1 SUMF1/EgtB/PvdO family nonheme iron enzyme [Leptospiraceae bacterium]
MKQPKKRNFFFFSVAFFCFLSFRVSIAQEDFVNIGTIVSIHNKDYFTMKVDDDYEVSFLKSLIFQKQELYLLKENEIHQCFQGVNLFIQNSKLYLNLIKVPCKYEKPISSNEYFLGRISMLKQKKDVTLDDFVAKQNQDITQVREIIHPVDKKIMIYVPEGYLLYGQGDDPNESSFNIYYHQWNLENLPKISAFYIDKYEVTNQEFYIFCRRTQYPCPDFLYRLSYEERNHPFIHATYKDVEAYARWTGKQIPTEWEWEYAARGDLERVLNHSLMPSQYLDFPSQIENCNTLEKWQKEGNLPKVIDVYQLTDINFRGIVGMCGNAIEWTSSYFIPYPGSRFSKEIYQRLSGKFFYVLRGGSYHLPLEKAKVFHRTIVGSNDLLNGKGGFRLLIRSK